MILKTDRGDAGRRIDLVLRRHLAGVGVATRTRIQDWIEAGHVSVNGAAVRRVSTRTAAGDVIAVAFPRRRRGGRWTSSRSHSTFFMRTITSWPWTSRPASCASHARAHERNADERAALARAPLARGPAAVARGTPGQAHVRHRPGSEDARDTRRAAARQDRQGLSGAGVRPVDSSSRRDRPAPGPRRIRPSPRRGVGISRRSERDASSSASRKSLLHTPAWACCAAGW